MPNNSTKLGFTLAEVLITLCVVGILASATIPALVQTTRDKELKVAWQKFYAIFSQATISAVADNGGTLQGIPIYYQPVLSKYLNYMSYKKNCTGWDAYDGNCWHSNDGTVKYLNGNPAISVWPDEAGMLLNNGMMFLLGGHTSVDCSNFYDGGYDTPLYKNSNSSGVCAYVIVDVNGGKNPNTIGKDIFGLYIFPTRVLPFGSDDNAPPATDCTDSGEGWGCSAKYLTE
ncbi:MAG: prepilin-type N-terminal cleavage/methylation domain-containing protein [Candidatus Gastranaerophilaceae bacterium]|jgi:prepilin-type N-terminal cleavage/methylation domain-containing protein